MELLIPEMQKLYFTIGEVAGMFNVNASLIRFWEKEFDCIKPKKNKKGNRLFTSHDIENIRLIYHLVKEKGYTLQGAKEEIKLNRKEVENRLFLINTLQRNRELLISIRDKL